MYSPLEPTANEEQVYLELANVLHIDIDGVEMELMKKTHLFWAIQMDLDIALVMFKILIILVVLGIIEDHISFSGNPEQLSYIPG